MGDKRKIIHVDMDAFYASIEMRDNPILRSFPLVIARDPTKNGGHGVVATANYKARSYGIHSAMSSQEAWKLCPEAYFKAPDFKKYRLVSRQIHQIFHEYTDIIEPVALDEAYLDLTYNKKNLKSAILIAKIIRQKIFKKEHLTCSVGISYNKFLAKLASDYHKPNGMTFVSKNNVSNFLFPLPIEKFQGVGDKTKLKMHQLGIFNGKDLYNSNFSKLTFNFGKIGYIFYQRIRGIDHQPVRWQYERKSLGNERTFDFPLKDSESVKINLKKSASRLAKELNQKQKHGKTLVLKVRNSAFKTITRRVSLNDYLPNQSDIFYFYGKNLLDQIQSDENYDIRLLGLTIAHLDPLRFENMILPLWGKKNNSDPNII